MKPAILAVGSYVPEGRQSNEEVERRLGLEAGWIAARTGITQRPIAAADEATSDLAVRAGEAALQRAQVSRGEVSLLLLATSTPDYPLPPSAPAVAHRLGLSRAGAIDLTGACAGFIYALALADAQLRVRGGCALVIGANVLSRRVDPHDAGTAALFGDGAGALLLGPREHDDRGASEGGSSTTEGGLRSVVLSSDGEQADRIRIDAGGSRQPMTAQALDAGLHHMRIDHGPAVFRHAVEAMVDAGREALRRAGLDASDIAWWVPHQANWRITRETGRGLGIPAERTVDVVDRFANSSAATIPIALAWADRQGLLQAGQLLLLTAVGAGMISAGAVLEWS